MKLNMLFLGHDLTIQVENRIQLALYLDLLFLAVIGLALPPAGEGKPYPSRLVGNCQAKCYWLQRTAKRQSEVTSAARATCKGSL
jgi:hypothetical protein